MKTLICAETNVVRLTDVEQPHAGAGELIVQVRGCGICGTDTLKVYSPDVAKPVQLGHEIVADVVESRTPAFTIGERIVVAHHAPCYVCHYCRHGNYSMCAMFKASGIAPGGFSEYVRVPQMLVGQTVLRAPMDMSDERAVFTEPLACVVRALHRLPAILPGDTVAVVGSGSIGLLFVALLNQGPANIAALDLRADRLESAKAWGAALTVNPAQEDAVKAVQMSSEGRGADIVILTVASATTFKQALGMVRDGGTILIFGAKINGEPTPTDLWEIYRRELTVLSSYSATPPDLHEALNWLHLMPLERMITHRLSLAEGQRGMDLSYRQEALKVVLQP